MRFEIYMLDGQLCQAFEYLFGLLQKCLMFVQRAQTHVVLSKEIEMFNLLQFARSGNERWEEEGVRANEPRWISTRRV